MSSCGCVFARLHVRDLGDWRPALTLILRSLLVSAVFTLTPSADTLTPSDLKAVASLMQRTPKCTSVNICLPPSQPPADSGVAVVEEGTRRGLIC